MGEMFFNWAMMVSMMDPFRNSKGFFIVRSSLVMSCTPVCERGVALLMKSITIVMISLRQSCRLCFWVLQPAL